MPSVNSNTKYRCGGCNGVFDLQIVPLGPGACPNCGSYEWHQITVVQVCDFCGIPSPAWRFPCREFAMPSPPGGPQHMSDDDWSACDICKDFVEANELQQLSHHAMLKTIERSPDLKGAEHMVEKTQNMLHQLFAQNRTGPAEPIS